MREINYRAWDKRAGDWFIFEVAWFSELKWVEAIWNEVDIDKYKVCQSTGNFDKNGKEIYEGDIVQTKAWHEAEDGSVILSEANSFFKKSVIEWHSKEPFVGYRISSDCEVIGNVWETPELLQ